MTDDEAAISWYEKKYSTNHGGGLPMARLAFIGGVEYERARQEALSKDHALEAAVWLNLRSGVENGHGSLIFHGTLQQVADDLTMAADLEQYYDTTEQLIPHIKSWRDKHG